MNYDSKKLYNEFLMKEKAGQYCDAWTPLMNALYNSKAKTYGEVVTQMYTRSWYQQRKYYLNFNDNDWKMTVFKDSIKVKAKRLGFDVNK